MGWHTSGSADEFLAAAGDFLRARPVENTVPLTVAEALRERGPLAYGPETPVLGWYTAADGTVTGAFLQTPPHPVLLTTMPADAVTALAGLLAGRPLSGVTARIPDAEAFAAARQRLTGATAAPGMRTRLYRLGALVPPPEPPGHARRAGPAHRDLLIAWFGAFRREAHGGGPRNDEALVDDRLAHDGITVWEAGGEPVAMAAVTRPAAGTVRVATVYTPPAQRGRGYGAAVTAAATRAVLDAGADDVVLFTDTANRTSNALYERLGYRPVEDRTTLEFA